VALRPADCTINEIAEEIAAVLLELRIAAVAVAVLDGR
jgi:hypothetical protein